MSRKTHIFPSEPGPSTDLVEMFGIPDTEPVYIERLASAWRHGREGYDIHVVTQRGGVKRGAFLVRGVPINDHFFAAALASLGAITTLRGLYDAARAARRAERVVPA